MGGGAGCAGGLVVTIGTVAGCKYFQSDGDERDGVGDKVE